MASVDKDRDFRVAEILQQLVPGEARSDGLSKKKLCYITLQWLYDTGRSDKNIFDKINEVFADFDYPEEMYAFSSQTIWNVIDGYDPRKHSDAETQARMLEKWKDYLDEARSTFEENLRLQ